MFNKFPQKVVWKWNRFDWIEQWFILYCFLLAAVIIFSPIIQIIPLNGGQIQNYYILNKYMIEIDIIIISSLVFMIIWNLSFRFKSLINILIWFKENDALLNFLILFLISTSFLSVSTTIKLLKNNFSNSIQLTYYYYLVWWLLIIWLLWNLLLALKLSKWKRKWQIINISNYDHTKKQEDEEKFIKWLFEE